jgi:hypothetical protein
VFDDYDEATIYTDYVDKQLLNEMTAMVHNVPAALGNLQKSAWLIKVFGETNHSHSRKIELTQVSLHIYVGGLPHGGLRRKNMIFGLKYPEIDSARFFGEFSNEVGWHMNDRTVEITNLGPISVENLIFRWIFKNRENPIILSKNANFSLFYPISAKDFVEKPTKTPQKLFSSHCRSENLDILRSPPCGNLPHICANWPWEVSILR